MKRPSFRGCLPKIELSIELSIKFPTIELTTIELPKIGLG
jgi:hypothetical protein